MQQALCFGVESLIVYVEEEFFVVQGDSRSFSQLVVGQCVGVL